MLTLVRLASRACTLQRRDGLLPAGDDHLAIHEAERERRGHLRVGHAVLEDVGDRRDDERALPLRALEVRPAPAPEPNVVDGIVHHDHEDPLLPLAVRFAVAVVPGHSAMRISRSVLASTSPTLSIATCGQSGPLVTRRKVRPSPPLRSVPPRKDRRGPGGRSPMDRAIGTTAHARGV